MIAGSREDSEGGEGEEGEGRRGVTLLASWAPEPAIATQAAAIPHSVLVSDFADTMTCYPDFLWETQPLLLDKTQSDSCKEGQVC